MFSTLLLASVVDANTVSSISENLISEKLMAASISNNLLVKAQHISSQLRVNTLNYVRRRRLAEGTAAACAWSDSDSKCTLSPQFFASSAANTEHASLREFGTQYTACSKIQEEAACTGNCAFKSGKCEVSDAVGDKLFENMLKDNSENCGALVTMIHDDCSSKVKTACTDKCEWHESGDFKLDDTDNKCKPVGQCKKKADPTDPFGMNKLCPNMAAVQAECDAKSSDTAKMDCFAEKCPIMLMIFGAMGCGASETADKCSSLGELCLWETEKCELNAAYVVDQVVPEGCWLRPVLEDSMECGKHKSAGACTGRCEWQQKSECNRAGDPDTKQECGSNGQNLIAALLGKRTAQQQSDCEAAASPSACASVETVPADAPFSSDAAAAVTGALALVAATLATA